MLLILEFRREWPNQSLLTADEVNSIRTAVDNALFMATSSSHVGDIYDMNPTVWAIWVVQRAHTLRVGTWTVESAEVQQRLSFENLYRWLEQQHARRERHDLQDPTTKKVVHRYVQPFKKMVVPPAANNWFKYRKGAQRLSDWITGGSSDGQAIIRAAPGCHQHAAADPRGAAFRRCCARGESECCMGEGQQRRSTLGSVVGDSDDAQETRQDDELAADLEREMAAEEGDGGTGPSQNAGGASLDDIQNELMRDSDTEDALDEFERQIEDGESADGGAG
eukprot:1087124-Prymnesium_polylepis.2